MIKITFKWALTLVLLTTLVTGCVSFTSVKQTAMIGTQLSSQENVFDMAPAFCKIANIKSSPDPQCVQLEKDIENWHKVNRSLVAYAKALNAMADDAKDRSYKDDISTMLGAASKIDTWSSYLPSNVTSGISAGVNALIHSITGFYRRAELKQVIMKNDIHVQNIASGFDQEIAALDNAAQNIQKVFGGSLATIDAGRKIEKDAMRIAYLDLSMSIDEHRSELAKYKKSIDAFAKAHSDLKEHINSVGDRNNDLEVCQMIAKDVSTIFGAISTAMTSTNK